MQAQALQVRPKLSTRAQPIPVIIITKSFKFKTFLKHKFKIVYCRLGVKWFFNLIFFLENSNFFWDLKNSSEISKIFLRSQKYFWNSTFFKIHFSPWRGFWYFCHSTLEDWHPGVVVMLEKHFLSLNWAIYDDFSLIKKERKFSSSAFNHFS